MQDIGRRNLYRGVGLGSGKQPSSSCPFFDGGRGGVFRRHGKGSLGIFGIKVREKSKEKGAHRVSSIRFPRPFTAERWGP